MMKAIFFFVFVFLGTALAAFGGGANKKRVLIISLMNDAEVEAFYSLLEQKNPDIDGSFRPTSLDESDVVVYLLDSWVGAPNVPGARELPSVFEGVYEVKSPTLSHNVFATTADGRSVQFIFYSLYDSGYAPIKCFALDISVEVKRELGDFFENSTLIDCAGLVRN